MNRIKRFFECLLPITSCNMKCSYCYVMQRDKRYMKKALLKYSPAQIGDALSKERLGGICYFSICGAGETCLQPEIAEIVYNILKHGHFVNITTNGTITKQIEKILTLNKEYVDKLHFAFSFHYLELKRLNMMDTFFLNVKKVHDIGASFLIQVNLCDEYEPYLEDIKKICIEHTGAMPQVAATRKESIGLRKIELLTSHTEAEYKAYGDLFNSPLFDFTMKNFNIKRKEFCYAGDWAGNLNLATGELRRCYCSYLYRQDIFKNPKKEIKFLAIGNWCGSPFCMNSSHFMSFGIIPELSTPTYAHLRNRDDADWYNETAKFAMSCKLSEENTEYGSMKKAKSNIVGFIDSCLRIAIQISQKVLSKNNHNNE